MRIKTVDSTIPFALEPEFYAASYADLAHMPHAEATKHFFQYGVAEGRQGAPLGCRPAFSQRIANLASVLEIGPFCNPTLRGANVRYLDVLDADQLRNRAHALDIDASGVPDHIHYLGEIDQIEEAFDGVVSSHAIEHQPDLIRHLRGVAKVLKPGSGHYYVFVPDKRYCFDHFIPESTIADVIQAHSERRTLHTLQSVIEHHALNTHNDPGSHWAGIHGEQHPLNQPGRILEAMNLHRKSTDYIDVHAWYFTPENFWNIMNALHACGMITLRPTEIYTTLRNTNEFFAVLKHDG
jgi:SAM-dependent methyltransferase